MASSGLSGGFVVVGTKRGREGILRWPELIRAYQGDRIVWLIANNHRVNVRVALQGFRHGRLEKALDFAQRPNPVDVPRGAIGRIDAKVGRTPSGLYTYAIFINGALAEDPEIEIERD